MMKSLLLAAALLAAAPALAQTKKTTTTTKKTTTTTKKATAPAKPAVAKAAPAPAKPAPAPLTQEQAASGLREALTTSVTNAVAQASAPDGFSLDESIRIPFPPDAQLVATTLGALPGGQFAVNQATNLLNRAAEAAAPQAKSIFLDAVKNLTLTDALTLVTSTQKDAATQLLRKNSEAAVAAALRPSIVQSLTEVGAEAAYKKLIDRYNKIPLMTPASADLTDYVTKETVDGLFTLMAQQEAKIRQNPAAQTTAILQQVFGRK